MSTTRELVDIIVDLKASISKKDAIIDKLQEYISKNSLNAGENKEYDRVVLENVELRQKLEYYEKPTPSHFDTMVGRLDDQNWG